MENHFPLVLLFVPLIMLAVIMALWHFAAGNTMLTDWARTQGYKIVRQEYCHVCKGPFFWTSSKGQAVFYVTVEDEHGTQRTGWVRCGGYFGGMLTDQVEARWEQ